MPKSFNIYYQDLPNPQVSTDEKRWISICGYNDYNTPYFNLTESKDWCTIETSKDENWWICFVKLQNNGKTTYFRGFERIIYLDEIIIFECYEVVKNGITNKWIKKYDEYCV